LIAQIRRVFDDSRQTYGSPRICAELRGRGVEVCVNTVARYMRQEGLGARTPRRFVPMTTDTRHDQPIAANVLDRAFTRAEPNTGWVSDITYVPTAEGWLFLAVVIDLYSRRIVGHATSDRLKSSLALEALEMALRRRSPAEGAWPDQDLLHHSDRGVQYASTPYRAVLAAHGIQPSMSRRGNCYDNAVAESFFATLKRELVHRQSYATRDAARQSLFEYIEVFYNRQRRHSALGYVSPDQFEKQRAVA
jgi:transposase InsO family protein